MVVAEGSSQQETNNTTVFKAAVSARSVGCAHASFQAAAWPLNLLECWLVQAATIAVEQQVTGGGGQRQPVTVCSSVASHSISVCAVCVQCELEMQVWACVAHIYTQGRLPTDAVVCWS